MKLELSYLLGGRPADSNSFKHRMRIHQGWWRAFVLGLPAAAHPKNPGESICNRMVNGRETKLNFLTGNSFKAFEATLAERKSGACGMIDEERVVNNLLSSQPLCFNFFGEMKMDLALATSVVKCMLPRVRSVERVQFEYAPEGRFTQDNSAFDVAFFYMTVDGKRGILGLECKYTDSFSTKEYTNDAYREIYRNAAGAFKHPYEEYTSSRYNQLFRNELIAQALIQQGLVDEAVTGLFHHPQDESAREIGLEFQGMLCKGDDGFMIISHQDIIKTILRLDMNQEYFEWAMLLWARYCGTELSEAVCSTRDRGKVNQ